MIVFINGRFVNVHEAVVPVFDRSFLYGDGLFETVYVHNSRPFRFGQHLARLQHGAEFLRIRMPFDMCAVTEFGDELIAQNRLCDGVLRIHLSRGVGQRGYSTKGADQPTLVMTVTPFDPGSLDRLLQWRLVTSSVRLDAESPLASFKTANKLLQIIARAEAESAGADEALLLNTAGHVVEAASANLFWISDSQVCTAPVVSGILPGVTRAVVFELCAQLGLTCIERTITPAELRSRQGVFLTLSTLGIVEAIELDAQPLHTSELTLRLWRSYRALVERETA
jgi:aminodeoxychorismate lyase